MHTFTSRSRNTMHFHKSHSLSISCIVIILCFISTIPSSSSSSSSSSSDDRSFQILDVAVSLQQAREVFSPSFQQQKQQPLHPNSSSPFLSLTLHSLSSLLHTSAAVTNYSSLTLSRLARDQARVRHLLSSHSLSLSRAEGADRPPRFQAPVTSGFELGTGEYLARVGVGRPVKQFYFAIDTGSDVSWLQCRPCAACYQQSDPIFDPNRSSTYRPLPCGSRQCAALTSSACYRGRCLYQLAYGDGSSTVGTFATETITFGSSGSVAGVAIGCGRDNQGLFSGSAGLLGLGGGALSLPSQLKAASFSYCLVGRDSGSTSTLEFDSAEPAGSIVAPMLTNPAVETYRYVGLTGISVGGRPVRLRRGAFAIGRQGRGGVIVDSGTTVTRFPAAGYAAVRDAFRVMARDLRLRYAGGVSILDTCYDFAGMTAVRVPTVSFHFAGGETLPLPASNYLVPVDGRGTHCFAFAGTPGSLSIIGNIQQQQTRVSYNLAKKYIAFTPNNC